MAILPLAAGGSLFYALKNRNTKTNLNRKITSIEDARQYLRDLHDNNEAYHPDDSADSIEWAGNAPDANECIKLDELMDACRDLLTSTKDKRTP